MEIDMEIDDLSDIHNSNYKSIHLFNRDASASQIAAAQNSSIAPEEGMSLDTPIGDQGLSMPYRRGVKRARVTIDEEQPSVRVVYSSLTRESKQKLGELLQQWTEWHSKHSPLCDTKKVLESGEEMYFPSMSFNQDDKASAVFFWMDIEQRSQPPNESSQLNLDSSPVPIYDRGYSFGLTSPDGSGDMDRRSEVSNFRCFNCGSYNHSLKDCPKPRDSVAINTAREKHSDQRSKNPISRGVTRYYQDSPRGIYDGLKPGTLDAETRKLLGLGELDPPPWLHRMRELGYPPGYLDLDEEFEDDKPSGITIFADNEIDREREVEEIKVSTSNSELPRKKSVEFPGVNAPIPENADQNRWAARTSKFADQNRWAARTSKFDSPGGQAGRMQNSYSIEGPIRRDFYQEERRAWDEGPPGCDPSFNHHLSQQRWRYEYLSPGAIGGANYHGERLLMDEGPPGCEPQQQQQQHFWTPKF